MNAKDALKMAALGIDALQVIQGLTRVGGDKAAAALETIDKIVRTMQDGFDGKTSPTIVKSELDAFKQALQTNDDVADQRLADRFKKEE